MDTRLNRIELTGLPGLAGLTKPAAIGGGFSGRPERSGINAFRPGFLWLPVALIAGFATWLLLAGYASKPAESEPVSHAASAVTEPLQPPSADAVPNQPPFNPLTVEAIVPEQPAPVDGLKISSQSWRRGGLGSNALVTFTLRNGNDYAVKDIEIFCTFARRDGSHLTDRTRMIPDTVNMKSRRTFARMHIGFINVNASKAKCSPVAASRI